MCSIHQTSYKIVMESSDLKMPATVDPEKGGQTMVGTPNKDFLTGFKLYMTLFSVIAVGFSISLDASIVVTVRDPRLALAPTSIDYHQAIPRITADFHSIADIGWYGSACMISK